ncbi:hypothetical protein LDENG_00107290, partial [Lucifuga dentata]
VPADFKHAVLQLIIKKPNLDPTVLSNFRPISKLPFLSKVQESILGLFLFSLYMLPLGVIFKKYDISFRCYKHDSQTYLPLKRTIPLKALLDCLDDIKIWMALNCLNLNEHKTDIVLFGPPDLHATLSDNLSPLGPYNKSSVKKKKKKKTT